MYRILFEVFGIDLEAPEALPKPRTSLPDEDYLSPDLERKLTWQEIAAYQVNSGRGSSIRITFSLHIYCYVLSF